MSTTGKSNASKAPPAAAGAASAKSTKATTTTAKAPRSYDPQYLLMLTVSPGRLGITLEIKEEGEGAVIKAIDPACTFLGQVEVGDRILTVDGEIVTSLEDLTVNKDRLRKFGILKAPRKPTFAVPTDMMKYRLRMAKLLQHDKRTNQVTQVKLNDIQHQVLLVPLSRSEKLQKRELDAKCFRKYNYRTGFFDQFLDAWASYCDGTQEDATRMVLNYMAKRFPQMYLEQTDAATNHHVKNEAGELPPNFVSHDGTYDVKWNTRYGDLIQYQKEHGDCRVHTRTELGRWVLNQRISRNQNSSTLTEKRINLLDSLGFIWCAKPEGWAAKPAGGDPRQNRAIAAKMMYPDLLIRECLLLGGYEEEELNVVKNPKHAWRTVCVAQKTKIEEYISNYEKTRKSQKHAQIDALVEILKGEGEDRFEKVFEGKSHLLPGFLVAAEDRRMNGYSEVRKPRAPKRKRDDTTNNLQGGGLEDGDDVDHLIDHADVHGEMMPEHHPDAHMNPMHHQEAQWQQQSQYQYWR